MNKNEIWISECFKSIQGEGPLIGMPTIFVRVFGCNMKPVCPWCIEKNTEITTTTGIKKANNVNIGDELITPLGNTNIIDKKKRKVKKYIKLKLENGKTLKCTLDHPLIDIDGNQISAKNLKRGDKIMCVLGDIIYEV